MKAYLRSVRIAPKKANLVAKMVRGKPVPDALVMLERTNKKAARILEQLIRSAMANASHNLQQNPQQMIVKTLVVNQGQAYHRGVPMARGRVRPMRKFLSHIEVALGYADDEEKPKAAAKQTASASKKAGAVVQKKRESTKKATSSAKRSSSSSSSTKSS